MELAERKTEQLGIGIPTLNTYRFDDSCLHNSNLSVLEFQEYSREWAEFVLMNRRNRTRVSSHCFDIVIGPIVTKRIHYDERDIYDRRDFQGNRMAADTRTSDG